MELQLAKAKTELKALTVEKVKLKGDLDKTTQELSSLKGAFGKNPLKALEQATGKTLKEIFEAGKRGDYDDKVAQLPEEVREKLSYLDTLKAEAEARKAEAEQAQKRQAREAEFNAALPKIRDLIQADADKFPYLAATEKAAERALVEIYDAMDRGETPNVQEILNEGNEAAKRYASFWLRQTNLVKLLASDDAAKQSLIEALGLNKQTPTSQVSRSSDSAPPKAAPTSVSTLNEVASRQERPLSDEDRRREIAEEWARIRSR